MLTRTVRCAAVLVLYSAALLEAQTGQITGLILDPASTAVPGAVVAITNVATGVRTQLVSNEQGYYTALYLNPGDYVIRVQKEPFTYGNSGRNILYGRVFRNWDFIVVRNFPVYERARLQFRGEFFNFTNTPAFGGPVSNIQASNAGQVLSAGEPRSIQLALKLIW